MNSKSIDYSAEWLVNEVGGREHIIVQLIGLKAEFEVTGQLVVELGSGIGTNLQVFLSDNKVLGVEGLESAVSESVERGVPAVLGNLEQPLDMIMGDAGCILCIDVLEHLMRPEICLASAHRALRENGILVVNVPNHFDWRGRLRVLFGSGIDSQKYFPNSNHWQYPHVRFFQRESIEQLLKSCGFEISRDFSPNFPSVPKARLLKKIGLGWVGTSLAKAFPDLFTSGFFLVCRKSVVVSSAGFVK